MPSDIVSRLNASRYEGLPPIRAGRSLIARKYYKITKPLQMRRTPHGKRAVITIFDDDVDDGDLAHEAVVYLTEHWSIGKQRENLTKWLNVDSLNKYVALARIDIGKKFQKIEYYFADCDIGKTLVKMEKHILPDLVRKRSEQKKFKKNSSQSQRRRQRNKDTSSDELNEDSWS